MRRCNKSAFEIPGIPIKECNMPTQVEAANGYANGHQETRQNVAKEVGLHTHSDPARACEDGDDESGDSQFVKIVQRARRWSVRTSHYLRWIISSISV